MRLIRLIRDELLIIVGTSSSETVLPRLLAKLEAAGASKQVTGMVIPTGYSFNLDGTCIYLTLGALFIVQAPGRTCRSATQIASLALMILTSKGAAGITGAGLVTLTASLQAFGGEFFSAESIAVGIALVVGIDRIMSEGRALTNCIGNGVATMVIAKWQGERDEERFQRALRDPSEVEGRPTRRWPARRRRAQRGRQCAPAQPGRSRSRLFPPESFERPGLGQPQGARAGRGRRPRASAPPLPSAEGRLEAARVAELVAAPTGGPWRASAGPCRHRRQPSWCRAGDPRSRRRRDRFL